VSVSTVVKVAVLVALPRLTMTGTIRLALSSQVAPVAHHYV
jgi:hypothetical protein